MKDKIIALISSPRFIGLVIVGGLQALVLFNVISGPQGEGLTQIIQAIIGGAIVIKTVDRNTGDAAKGTTTVSIPSNVTGVTATTQSDAQVL